MRDRGFTLLELVIAFAILAGGLAVLSHAQLLSLRGVRRARLLTVATQLARLRMVELEDELKKEGFSEFSEQDEGGDFSDEGFRDFRWQSRVEKIELPGTIDAQAAIGATGAGTALGLGEGAAATGGLGEIFGAAASAMSGSFELIRDLLEQSVRKATLVVTWHDGSIEQQLSVQTYFTDPTRIDSAGGIAPAAGGIAPAARGLGTPFGQPTVRRQ